MYEVGYIKLYRSITSWEWFNNPNTLKVWLYLLTNANWKDGRFEGEDVPAGSLIIGRKSLSKELHLSERSIRTALNHLKSTNEVTIKSTKKFSLVTIVKWANYQGEVEESDQENVQESDQQVTNKRPTNDQQVTTIEEGKNVRKEERNKSINQNEQLNKEGSEIIGSKGGLPISRRLAEKIGGSYASQ